MALKRLKIKAVKTPGSKSDIPTLLVEGELVSQYLAADKQKKEADDVMKTIKPELVEAGVREILRANVRDPQHPTPTFRVEDEKGEVVQVQFTKSYSAVADVAAAELLFGDLKLPTGAAADINDFAQEVIVVELDNKAFYDAEGNYLPKVYTALRDALQAAADKLGIDCPLSARKQIVPKEAFHTERFTAFPTLAVQEKLTAVFTNTVRVVPVTAKK